MTVKSYGLLLIKRPNTLGIYRSHVLRNTRYSTNIYFSSHAEQQNSPFNIIDTVVSLFSEITKRFLHVKISLRNHACYATRVNDELLTYSDT